MTTTLKYTANDTYPTTLTFTDNGTVVNMTGFVVKIDIAYPTPLTVTANSSQASIGIFTIEWIDKQLVAGDWQAKIVVTDANTKIISTDFITLNIDSDITPSL